MFEHILLLAIIISISLLSYLKMQSGFWNLFRNFIISVSIIISVFSFIIFLNIDDGFKLVVLIAFVASMIAFAGWYFWSNKRKIDKKFRDDSNVHI